jgi:hypothetical protein
MSDARQWVIGRAPDCDIVMSQSDVYGKHRRLYPIKVEAN